MFGSCEIDLKMDVRDMKAFEAASFDAVIDKGIISTFVRLRYQPNPLCFM